MQATQCARRRSVRVTDTQGGGFTFCVTTIKTDRCLRFWLGCSCVPGASSNGTRRLFCSNQKQLPRQSEMLVDAGTSDNLGNELFRVFRSVLSFRGVEEATFGIFVFDSASRSTKYYAQLFQIIFREVRHKSSTMTSRSACLPRSLSERRVPAHTMILSCQEVLSHRLVFFPAVSSVPPCNRPSLCIAAAVGRRVQLGPRWSSWSLEAGQSEQL